MGQLDKNTRVIHGVFNLNDYIGCKAYLYNKAQPLVVFGMYEGHAYVGTEKIKAMRHKASFQYLKELDYAGLTGWGHPPFWLGKVMYDNRYKLLRDSQGKLPVFINTLLTECPSGHDIGYSRCFDDGIEKQYTGDLEFAVWPTRNLSPQQYDRLRASLLKNTSYPTTDQGADASKGGGLFGYFSKIHQRFTGRSIV